MLVGRNLKRVLFKRGNLTITSYCMYYWSIVPSVNPQWLQWVSTVFKFLGFCGVSGLLYCCEVGLASSPSFPLLAVWLSGRATEAGRGSGSEAKIGQSHVKCALGFIPRLFLVVREEEMSLGMRLHVMSPLLQTRC